MDAGLENALSDLWIDEIDAVGETPEPIDFGDKWAWAGDNAKLLSVMARTDLIHGREAHEMRTFIEQMTFGPILFQRWANTHEPLIVTNRSDQAEVSNHLLTVRVDKANLRAGLEFEYHDGRDKRMVEFGPARVLIDGTWRTPNATTTRVEVIAGAGFVDVRFRYEGELRGLETFRLDRHPGMLHFFEAPESAGIDGVRFWFAGMEVVSTDRVLDAGHYREVVLGHAGTKAPRAVTPRAPGPFPWLLFVDKGTTDEFANGLLVTGQGGSRIEGLAEVKLRGDDAGAFQEIQLEHGKEADRIWSERVVPLVGLVTAKPQLYGDLAGNLTARKFEGRDLSLSYEYSETVLGLLHYAEATGDKNVLARAQTMLEHYLSFYQRGTQTRSLASGILAALSLHESTGDAKWKTRAEEMAKVLRTYQVQERTRGDFGSVINEPKGGPFLDSTILAARSWHELFEATGRTDYRNWSDLAWNSLVANGERIFVKGDEADDNHWSFKSGLILQSGSDVRDDLRWAARNHLWTVLRDPDDMQFMTSRFTDETNSETQAWALLGMYEDWLNHDGPWILDSEGTITPLSGPSEKPIRLQAPWIGAYVWMEPGWIVVDANGVPESRIPGPYETWRYTASGPVLSIHAIEPRRLAQGWNAIGFPGLLAGAPPDRLLHNLPIKIAWTIDPASGEWQYWRPNDTASTLRTLLPSQGVLIDLSRDAFLEAPGSTGKVATLRPGWNLAVPAPKTAREWWRGVDTVVDPLPAQNTLAGPFGARYVGVDVTGDQPQPPMLVLGQIEQDFVHRLRGGLVEARLHGELLAQTRLGLNGSYQLLVTAPLDTKRIDLVHYDPAEQQIERVTVDYLPGAFIQPHLAQTGTETLKPGALVLFVVLIASFAAVVTLALIWRNSLTRSD